MMPKPSGQCRLLDRTVILASGEKDVMGDPIQTTITVDGHDVTFDAVGVAAVRLDPRGQVAAMAAGGLKASACGDLHIQLPDPADIALWRDAQGQWQGVLQGHTGPIPDALTRITKNWTRLRLPAPLENEREN
jgi:hypothetical protein